MYKIITILFIIISFVACKYDNRTDNNPNIVHIRIAKDPLKLNPILKASAYSRQVYQYIMPSACGYNPVTLDYEPILFESLPTSTNITTGKYKGLKSINLKIKQNAKWDNGTPVTAHDYAFTIKISKHPLVKNTSLKLLLEQIKDVIIDTDNEKSFSVIIDGDYYMGLEMVSGLDVFPQYIYNASHSMDNISIPELNDLSTVEDKINSDSSLIQFAKEFNSIEYYKNQVSSFGPYRLAEWESDQYIRLVKKDNYWAKGDSNLYLQQSPDEIVFHIIPDEINAISQFKNGNIDVLTKLSATSYEQLKNDENIIQNNNLCEINSLKRYTIVLNHRSKYLSDINIRKALAYSIDVDEILKTIEYGYGKRISTDFSSSKLSYNHTLKPIEHDQKMALQYLSKSGWEDHDKDGFVDKFVNGKYKNLKINYLTSPSGKSMKIASLIKKQVESSGIKIEIVAKPFKQIRNQQLKNFDFDITRISISSVISFPDPYLRWHSDNTDIGEWNLSGFSNSEADRLIEKIRTSHDKDKQIIMYHRLQEILYDDQAIIPLYELSNLFVISKKFKTTCYPNKPGILINTFKK